VTLRNREHAPDFTLRDQHGRPHSLGSLLGERPALVVFFPYAFSGLCTGELRDLRDHAGRIDAAGAELYTVSCDSVFSLRVFADQEAIAFPLLSDFWPHGATARAYDAFDEEHGCPTRSTFLVDRDGLVRWSVHNVMREARSVEEYLDALDRLQASPA